MGAAITFGGASLKSAAEGGYDFLAGSEGNARKIETMARAKGLLYKELAFDGIPHMLTCFFAIRPGGSFSTQTTAVNTLRTRIQGFYEDGEGALVVPGFGSFNDCLLVGKPQWGPQQKITDGFRCPCTMFFIQLSPQT